MICDNHVTGTNCGNGFAPFERDGTNVVTLGRRATSAVRLVAGQSVTARGRAGTVWVTMEGDDQDYALRDGEIARFSGAGLLVAEGLSDYNEVVLEWRRERISGRTSGPRGETPKMSRLQCCGVVTFRAPAFWHDYPGRRSFLALTWAGMWFGLWPADATRRDLDGRRAKKR